ncbi:MAG: peptidoglycan-binding domain-containing protein [Paracoccaceae bacterium]|jgi:hypothetical protein
MGQWHTQIKAWGIIAMVSGCLAPVAPSDPNAPDGAPQGTCWAKWTQPAVLESRTYMRETQSGQFETYTEYNELEQRRDHVFQTPCPKVFTAYYIETLQRALKVRGFFDGPVTGIYDSATKAAIKAYQTTKDLPSDQLSVETAVEFGLLPVEINP